MITKNEILHSLESLSLPRGAVVTVHTSLRAIGEIDGGGQTLLDALIEHFTRDSGLLVIPTHTWGYLDTPSLPTLDLCEPKTNLGVLPTLALRDGRGVRSLHPTHSVTVFGDSAEEFARHDDATDTFASPDGCYGELLRRAGYILLIGVGNDKNTFIHCAEEILGVPNRNADKRIKTTVKHPNGRIEERMLYPMYTEGTDDISRYFPKYDDAFSYFRIEKKSKIGEADARLLSAVGIMQAVKKIFISSGGKEVLLCDGEIPEKYYK